MQSSKKKPLWGCLLKLLNWFVLLVYTDVGQRLIRLCERKEKLVMFRDSAVDPEVFLLCDGKRWPLQPSLTFLFPVGCQLHVVFCFPLLLWCHWSSPPSSSCRPGRSLPLQFVLLVFPELADRRWRPLVLQISSTSPLKVKSTLELSTLVLSLCVYVYVCVCVCVCVYWPQWCSVLLLCHSHSRLKGSILWSLHLKTRHRQTGHSCSDGSLSNWRTQLIFRCWCHWFFVSRLVISAVCANYRWNLMSR